MLVSQGTLPSRERQGTECLMRHEGDQGVVQSEVVGFLPFQFLALLVHLFQPQFLPVKWGSITMTCRVIWKLKGNQVGDTPGT